MIGRALSFSLVPQKLSSSEPESTLIETGGSSSSADSSLFRAATAVLLTFSGATLLLLRALFLTFTVIWQRNGTTTGGLSDRTVDNVMMIHVSYLEDLNVTWPEIA